MQMQTLKNGIPVILDPRPTEAAVIEVQINVGSNHENKKQAGMTHLIEHMLFEGTTTRTAQQISNAIESVGGEFNAATTQERTFYYIYIPKQHLTTAINIMADIIKNPTFDQAILKKEKNVVLNEILVVNDDPKQYQWVIFLNTLFTKHEAKNPVSGNAEAIKKMTREDILAYYTKYYTPANMTISLTGNIGDPLQLLNSTFGAIPTKSSMKEFMTEEPLQTTPRRKKVKMNVEHSYLTMGYHAPPKGHKDYYTLEVIRSILGRGQSSRLFEEIRTKRGIAYMVGCLYDASYSFGAFASYVSTEKKNLEEAKKVLREAFHLKDLTDQEVEDAKQYLLGSFILHKEDNKERTDMNAEWSLLRKDPMHYLPAIQRVTKKDVLEAAKKYFHQNPTEVLLQK